ncbi:hypothetical protein Bhyg_03508 [Pseudolycoriella hygida]|uniref:Uncharacterized protein n=1 Tax=Pseudolycoriella hygida TaxID=35572 RepID=A0A9Q0S9J4_9DIPT|nr:hypothetical protein Bhyg_17847 [Pseudolycoriella hygida]KAJ6648280.1 hypothetical protein Bhyg_03508 [Pseudolycoriella hygida]
MEVIVIAGKRENSKHFFISDLDEIYSNHSKANDVKFVCCYHDNCRARGKIGADRLFYASEGQHGQHSNHNFTTASVLNFLKCFNEMKEEARSSGKLPNVVYDEVMAKYHGSFERSLTFPSVQQTLLKCRRQYFPRFPQTADEFFKVFENQLILRRYGHCFDDLFFHGVTGDDTNGRCGIFYTKRLLDHFSSEKDEIKAFADATFKYQPSYFHQLFIVHFEIGNYVGLI